MTASLSDAILACLATHSEPVTLLTIIRESRVPRTRALPILDRLIGEGRISYNKMTKVYSQGTAIGRTIPLAPTMRGRTCAFDGFRDASVMTEHEGRMVPACKGCAATETSDGQTGPRRDARAQLERQVAAAVERLRAAGEEVTTRAVVDALGMASKDAVLKVGRIVAKYHREPDEDDIEEVEETDVGDSNEHSYATDGACDACGEPAIGGFGCQLSSQAERMDQLDADLEDIAG